jgi:hypothetical protein
VFSRIFRNEKTFNMVDVQNATLAGGVAIGASADLLIEPWCCMLVGMIAGFISVFGYNVLQKALFDSIRLHDTCGVHNLHGMPGILGALTAIITCAVATSETYGSDLGIIFASSATRSMSARAGYQTAALFTTLGVALVSGCLTGLLLRSPVLFEQTPGQLFDDSPYWHIPETVEDTVRRVLGLSGGNHHGATNADPSADSHEGIMAALDAKAAELRNVGLGEVAVEMADLSGHSSSSSSTSSSLSAPAANAQSHQLTPRSNWSMELQKVQAQLAHLMLSISRHRATPAAKSQ